MTTYEQLKAKIQAANPEIMELKFGCRGIWNVPASEQKKACKMEAVVLDKVLGACIEIFITQENTKKKNLTYRTATIFPSDFQNHGRDIRLADVLLALESQDPNNRYHVRTSGHIGNPLPINPSTTFVRTKWNLADDNLDHQRDDCKDSLIKILRK